MPVYSGIFLGGLLSDQHSLSNDSFSLENGWLNIAARCPSPNFNSRPANTEISLLVIHNISLPPEQFGGGYIQQFFCNQLERAVHPYFEEIKDLEVSSHFLIDRSGKCYQFVSLDERAWHAGKSSFQNKENCNDFSIGIELEGTDDIAYTKEQYQSLAQITQFLMQQYPTIIKQNIVGHCDIAPGRKTDPGSSFDWDYFLQLI